MSRCGCALSAIPIDSPAEITAIMTEPPLAAASSSPAFSSPSFSSPSTLTTTETASNSPQTGIVPADLQAFVQRLHAAEQEVLDVLESPRQTLSVADRDTNEGKLFKKMSDAGVIHLVTNFSESEILDLIRRSQPYWNYNRKRGQAPTLSLADHWILYTSWLKSGADIQFHAAQLNIKSSTAAAAINRIREVLSNFLQDRWWKNRARPTPLQSTTYPHIALLVDSTTIETQKPLGSFNESKSFFDGKNHVYGLKKEVAVMAQEPYYALFASKGVFGSVHDYTILKEGYDKYLSYLLKTPEETTQLPLDSTIRCWAALFDNGYVGPVTDTPGLRRVVVPRASHVPSQQAIREELIRLRCPVERFFGRLCQLWRICRGRYQWAHERFDSDIDICILLTNEHIKRNRLEEIDFEYWSSYLSRRALEREQLLEKKKSKWKEYQAKKKLKLLAATQMISPQISETNDLDD